MEALKVEGLSKNFGGIQVLHDIHFNIGVGEHVAIIGPNGAGKTTLFNVLTGELSPTAGAMYLFGQKITDMVTHRRIHLGLARSFQLNRLFLNLTILDNVMLALQGIKRSRFQMFRSNTGYTRLLVKAEGLLRSIGLWEKRDFLVKALSYGEQRQMEIALSLASEPKLLLLDEPTAGLSIAETTSFINMLRDLAINITVLFCAHDMDVVFSLAGRIMVLYFGEIIAQGTPKEIQADSTVKAVYLGIEEGKQNAGTG